MTEDKDKKPTTIMNAETIETFKDSIPILWDTKGKYLHSCGMRYRQAKPSEAHNVLNWASREAFKRDAERFALSSYATKAYKSKFITEDE
jgi:hypothetical protein